MGLTLYSVYEPGKDAGDPVAQAESLAFVKEGFSWPAFLIPLFWLLYQRMWIELVLFIIVLGALPLLIGTGQEAEPAVVLASLAISLAFAFEANDLRRWALERRGYRLAGIAVGKGREEAELSFLRRWLARQPQSPRQAERGPPLPEARFSPRGSEGEEVIGLFPKPG